MSAAAMPVVGPESASLMTVLQPQSIRETVIDEGSVTPNKPTSGHIRGDDEKHRYTFQGRQGQRVGILVHSPADSDLDPYVSLLDPGGRLIGEDDDDDNDSVDALSELYNFDPSDLYDVDSLMVATLPSTGTYTVIVEAADSDIGAYELTVAIR
jgi:hypothetical protein